MALRNIFKEGEPILRRKAREVVDIDDRILTLLDDMRETMLRADGVGLAAPQVGVSKRIVIIKPDPDSEEIIEMINPVVSEKSGIQVSVEGCLSVDSSKNCKVARPMRLKIEYTDRDGNPHSEYAVGFKARVICHETDHLDGILFIDKEYKGR